ncbi:MAG: ArsR/SmtB family transcription factor [Mycoplasmatales bacterium]
MDLLKLFADVNRIRIIKVLMEKQLCVCELVIILNLNQTNISNHLKVLKEANIIEMEKRDKWNYYEFNHQSFKNNKLIEYVQELDELQFKADLKKLKYINQNFQACTIKASDIEAIKREMECLDEAE